MPNYLAHSNGFPSWNEEEVKMREHFIERISFVVQKELTAMNGAWKFFRCETPLLISMEDANEEYSNSDELWAIREKPVISSPKWSLDDYAIAHCLRPETTKGSYAVARYLQKTNKLARPPFCVWQPGKSFRQETNDGASAANLRFNEFWQIEFQCIYSPSTKADYRQCILGKLTDELMRLTNLATSEIVESDRLPSYSKRTTDIELPYRGKMKEVASISNRTDYEDGLEVLEIAIGLDRLLMIWGENNNFEGGNDEM